MNQDSNCSPSGYPSLVDQSDGPGQFDPSSRFLIPDYQFGCGGRVSRWEVYVTGNGSHPLEFSVWRLMDTTTADPPLSTYALVGSNYVNDVTPDERNLLSVPVAQEEQIWVMPGDIAGIRSILLGNLSETISSPFQIQHDSNVSRGVLFYSLNETEETPALISVQSSQANNGTPFLRATVDGRYFELDIVIVAKIQFIIAAIPTTTTTTTTTTTISATPPTTDPSSPFPLVITVVVIVALVAVLAAASATGIAICCLLRRRCPRSKQALRRDGLPLTGNTTYGNLNVDDNDPITDPSAYSAVYLDDEESGIYYSTIRDL